MALLLAATAVAAGCSLTGGTNNVASHSPSPAASAATSTSASPPPTAVAQATPSPAPQPVTGAYGVLYTSQSSPNYTVSVIGVDGKVVASADASTPAAVSCANAAAALVAPPVSMSNSRVYFMDAQGVIRFLGPAGDSGRATTVPAGTASRRAMFAVSPDDRRIAVVVDDFTSSGASTHLYVEDLNGGGSHVDVFSESGARTLWPIGWHGTNNLVLGVVASCTQGGGPFCCGVGEIHVVDPATATRRFTLGAVSGCPIVGPPSPAGVVCWDGATSRVLNWTAGVVRTFAVQGPEAQLVSPDSGRIALVDNTGTSVQGSNVSWASLFACTWIDDIHVLSGGDPQHQPRIGEFPDGITKPVAAQGDCAGRLPGGL